MQQAIMNLKEIMRENTADLELYEKMKLYYVTQAVSLPPNNSSWMP